MSGLSLSWIDTIGWMLLHSLWHGMAVAMALALLLRLLRGAPAQARYLAACFAMALMIVLPVSAVGRPQAILSLVPARRAMDPQPPRAEEPADPEVDSTFALRPWQIRIVPILPAIVGLWMTGAGIFSVRLLGGCVLARRWTRRDTRPLVCPWIDGLKERMGICHAVSFLESAHVEVPMVIGWLRPVILVPVAALSGLTAPELEAILAHELAHIRRHDYLVNIVQCLVEVLMFYHPATWWITRVIRREREHCCDDMAVATSRDRLTYARALAAMEGLRAPAFSLSPAANGGNLLARVHRILKPEEESMKPVPMLLGLAAVLAVAPIWLARTDEKATKADPGSARPPIDRPLPFPNRSFADIVTAIEEAPTGRFMIRPLPPVPDRSFADILTEIRSIGFMGNQFATDAQLKTKISTRKPILGLVGKYHREMLDEDRLKLIDYYQKQGFFEVKITLVIRPNSEGKAELAFVVSEGTRYHVRSLIIEGNTKIKTEVLREGMELHSGKPFLDSVRNADKNRLLAKYHELGYIEAEIMIEPRFTEQHGVVDLVYKIEEKDAYLLGEVEIRGYARTKDKVLGREAVHAGLLPGEILDKNRIDMYKQRLGALHDLDKINDAEAEKMFRQGMYYKRIGKAASAEFTFGKILQRWPNSPWAVKAKAQQVQTEPTASDRTKVEFFNFLVGGFY